MEDSLIHSIDWPSVGMALVIGTIIGVLDIYKTRTLERHQGVPCTPWGAVLPAAIAGCMLGATAAFFAVTLWPPVRNGGGLLLLSVLGGLLGRKAVVTVDTRALPVLTAWLASKAGDAAKKALERIEASEAQKEGGDGDEQKAQ